MIDARRVIRPGGCQHPGISDAEVLAYHDAPAGRRQSLDCLVMHRRGEQHWECGQWFTIENADGDIVMVDEPPGAGN